MMTICAKQPSNSFRAVGVKVEGEEVVSKQEVRGVFGRLGKQEEVVKVKEEGEGRRKEQEARVTSTSEELRSSRASASPGRGNIPVSSFDGHSVNIIFYLIGSLYTMCSIVLLDQVS